MADKTIHHDITIEEIALNDLAFRSLNGIHSDPSDSTEQAIDWLSEWVRKGSLGIMVALLDVAAAIRESRAPDA